MFEQQSETQARAAILEIVTEYCKKYHNTEEYAVGDKISCAGRVYDSAEMVNLVDSSLECLGGLLPLYGR